MTDKNGTRVKIGDKISIDKEKQPVFEVVNFNGTLTQVKCIDDKGENFYSLSDTLLIPESALKRYEITE